VAFALVIAALALAVAWRRCGGRRGLAVASLICIGVAAVLFIVATIITTSGERARSVTLALVDAAVAGDVRAARANFSNDATMSFASPRNPGESIDFIQRSLEQLRGRYSIADNHVASLRSYSVASDRAVVHLRVITRLEQFPYQIPSSWVLEVVRQGNGAWTIDHITFVEYSGQAAGRDVFR
jgi:hypothetical protein